MFAFTTPGHHADLVPTTTYSPISQAGSRPERTQSNEGAHRRRSTHRSGWRALGQRTQTTPVTSSMPPTDGGVRNVTAVPGGDTELVSLASRLHDLARPKAGWLPSRRRCRRTKHHVREQRPHADAGCADQVGKLRCDLLLPLISRREGIALTNGACHSWSGSEVPAHRALETRVSRSHPTGCLCYAPEPLGSHTRQICLGLTMGSVS